MSCVAEAVAICGGMLLPVRNPHRVKASTAGGACKLFDAHP
jgi:hypothetical protein